MVKVRSAERCSDEAVKAKTGKVWSEWFAILDTAGAATMDHKQIVALLHPYGIDGWWQQMVAVGYEQERGLRKKHEKPDGFAVSVSKTVPVPLARLYAAWQGRERKRWMGEEVTVRKATENKSMRITWSDGTSSLSVNFYAKGDEKSQVVVQHEKLSGAKNALRMKAFWTETLDRLYCVLTDE